MITKRVFHNVTSIAPVQKSWSQARNTHFLRKIKDSLNSFLNIAKDNEVLNKESENYNSAENLVEKLNANQELKGTAPRRYGANVVIIGAGIAGLSAANHLCQNGVKNITVLEALNRPGGRIKSTWFYDSIIELGSPVAKIPPTNPIIHKAIEDGLMKIPLNQADPTRGLLLRNDGSIIPYPVSYEVYNLFKEILNEVKFLEENGENRLNKIEYIGSRIEQEVRYFPSNFKLDAERAFHGLVCATFNKSNHDSSFIKKNDLGTFIQLPGSKLNVPLGHFGTIDKLYQSLPKNKVKFGKSVIKIRWGGVSHVFPRADVTCEDGETYNADFVIITLPVGVLKAQYDKLFCPELPVSKLNAISSITQTHLNKIFLQFSQPFWMWNKYIKKIILDPDIMKCREGWIKGVHSIEPVRGSNHIMCLTITGPQAQCLETIVDKQVVSDVLPFIKELTKNDIPDPVGLERTCWSSDPQFGGAYSCMSAGMTSKDFYDLALPLPAHSDYCSPVLLFAGEATSSVQYGTVKGAMSSGIREAERLIQLARLLEENKCPENIRKQEKLLTSVTCCT